MRYGLPEEHGGVVGELDAGLIGELRAELAEGASKSPTYLARYCKHSYMYTHAYLAREEASLQLTEAVKRSGELESENYTRTLRCLLSLSVFV